MIFLLRESSIPVNINVQPIIPRRDNPSCRMSQPPITAKTDSRLRISAACAECASCWAMTCNVNAIPTENTPANTIDFHASRIEVIIIVSKINAHIKLRMDAKAN